MDINVQNNARKMCRTCLKVHWSRKELISVFEIDQTFSSKKVKFSEMLASIADHPVHEYDELPKRICVICLQAIRSSYYFKNQAENAYSVLLNQTETSSSVPFTRIKRENLALNSKSSPVISAPRTIENENFSDDLLLEIGSPKIQEPLTNDRNYSEEKVEEKHGNSIDDGSQTQQASSGSEKSPDSGIIDDRMHETSSYERELAKAQVSELCEVICDVCNKQMFSVKALARHKRNFHSENRCKFCKKRFGNRSQLKMHTKFKHPERYDEFRLNGQTNPIVRILPMKDIPECTTCGAIVYEREAMLRHHGDCDKKCIECGMKFIRKNSYLTHMEKEHGIRVQDSALECPFGCSDKFFSEKVLQVHIQQSHPEEKDCESTMSDDDTPLFPCTSCTSRFSNLRSLTQHIAYKHKLSVPELPKTRNVTKFTREEFIDKFMVRKSVDYHRCLPCKKDIHKRSLVLHLRGKHAAVKSYLCELCPESFFRIDYRQRHMIHCHGSQYRCNECSVQFDRAYKFDAHMVQHGIPAKNLRPEEGNDRFDLSSAQMKYIEDTSTYDYTTPEETTSRRSSVLSNSSSLQLQEAPMTKDEFFEKHLITLSDKYTHCSICQQKMMKNSIISHVLWKHALQKPLKCSFCNERVVKSAARLNHMARCHPNAYKCVECNVQFAKHDLYSSHMLEVHSKTVTSEPSSGEEEDLSMADLRFVGHKNEDEVFEDRDIEPEMNVEVENSSHQCKTCLKIFATSKNLQIHKSLKSHFGETSAEEPMTFDDFRRNYVETVNQVDVKCIACDQVMKKRNFGNHVKSKHATEGAFKCAICPEAFFRPEHRTQHMANVHRRMFFCDTCNVQFYQNSRYAKHLRDSHDIEVESHDKYEVDLPLSDLRFLPQAKQSNDDDQTISIIHEIEDDTEEADATNNGVFNRDDFIETYVKSINKDNRFCSACNKTVLKNSIYNHLMRHHALTLPFKCPFCDLRLERGQYRVRHLQIFHPNDYKCFECGLQFQTHSKFAEHMAVEHNSTDIPKKSEGEEGDLSSYDIRYVAQRAGGDEWQEDEHVEMKTKDDFLKPQIKPEPKDTYAMHSIFGGENSLLIEQAKPDHGVEYNYTDFKVKFIIEVDASNLKCVPCNRLVVKTSICAHLRLWHAIIMCYNCELCPDGFQRVDYRQRHMKFSHPNDFKCDYCEIQFHRSGLYKEHMNVSHSIRVQLKELKTKDEIDVPLEDMRFVEHVPNAIRHRDNDGEGSKRAGRPPGSKRAAINPEAGGLTYGEFKNQYIRETPEGFRCVICKMSMTKFSVKKHVKRFHATSKAFFCELCPEGFQRPDARLQHMDLMHNDSYRCFQCDLQFYMSSGYVDHMQHNHNMKILVPTNKKKCEVDVPLDCLRFLPQKLNNEDPPNGATKPTPVPRHRTDKSQFDNIPDDIELTREQLFGKFFRSIKRIPGENGELKTKCLACFKVFSSKNRLFHAMHNHALQRPLSCELCPQKFFLSSKRLCHMRRKHSEDYKCNECNLQYDRAQHFINHMQAKHQVVLDILVPDPDKINIPSHVMRYTKKSTAHREIMKQRRLGAVEEVTTTPSIESFVFPEDEQSLKCSECHEEFESERSLRIHMRNHSNVATSPIVEKVRGNVHECNVCQKTFLAAFALSTHKKYKHSCDPPLAKKRKLSKPKYDVECDICEFTSFRRDYVEHHVRTSHQPEFQCRYCSRILSNFNLFLYHIHDNHPEVTENLQRLHKCTKCHKCFRTIANMKYHRQEKHGKASSVHKNNCSVCGVHYKDAAGLEVHLQNHIHKSIQKFIQEKMEEPEADDWESFDETIEVGDFLEQSNSMMVVENETDPFQKMLEKKVKTLEEPNKSQPDEDKLDYLKFLQCHNGIFACSICGKTKTVRKHMLHHLKQHSEVPTFSCKFCPEKFVFKKKYEKHLLIHKKDLNVDEHPKFQEMNAVKNEIKCQICQMSFKLTIMLNRHNYTWHGEDNVDRELSMTEQKARKEELAKQELPPIKLLRCKHCLEAFIKPLELKEHLKDKHNSESVDQPPDEATQSSFTCDKCHFAFDEMKFLENHQKFFCVHRQLKAETETSQVVNEQ